MLIESLLQGLMVSGPLVIGAIGFTLVFKLDRVMNVAYAEFMTIPAYFLYLLTSAGFDFVLSFLVSMLAMGVIAIGLFNAMSIFTIPGYTPWMLFLHTPLILMSLYGLPLPRLVGSLFPTRK